MKFHPVAVALILLGLAAAPAPGQAPPSPPPAASAAPDRDARCVLALSALVGATQRSPTAGDAEGRQRIDLALSALNFFVARLLDGHPDPSLAAVLAATHGAFPRTDYPAEAQRCADAFGESMRLISTQLQEALTAAQPPAAPAGAAADADLICLAVFTETGRHIEENQARLSAEIVTSLRSFRVGTPFFAARILARYPQGAVGPALAAALRGWPRAQAESLIRNCFDSLGAATDRLAAAVPPEGAAAP